VARGGGLWSAINLLPFFGSFLFFVFFNMFFIHPFPAFFFPFFLLLPFIFSALAFSSCLSLHPFFFHPIHCSPHPPPFTAGFAPALSFPAHFCPRALLASSNLPSLFPSFPALSFLALFISSLVPQC